MNLVEKSRQGKMPHSSTVLVRDFVNDKRRIVAWGPPSLLYNGYRVFPEGKERPGRDADPSPLLVPWSRKSRAIPLLPLWAVRPVQSLSACARVHCTLKEELVKYCYVWRTGNLKFESWAVK